MPLDSVTVSALTEELRERVIGARIDKVQQPERDTLILSVRGALGSFRLAVCGGVGNARVHVTAASFENPQQPPMFCMLLRKHLVGARISGITQPERERIMIFELASHDEMGVAANKRLAVEMIGRGTNVILIGGDGIIIDCLRRVDSDMSALRQVQPGLLYRLPINQTKPDFFSLSSDNRREIWRGFNGGKPEQYLLDSFSCLSPLIARELVYRCCGDLSSMPAAMDVLAESVAAGDFQPYMLTCDGKPKDFSFMRISQYASAMQGESYPDFSSLLDAFYTRRGKAEDMKRRTQSLRKSVKTLRDRAVRKTSLQEEELSKTAGREQKRRWADLITANLFRLKGGAESVTVQDFYEDGAPELVIPLNPLKTPQQNAAAYYKEYNKMKTAERYLTELLTVSRRDADYLSSVLDEIDRAGSESDITDIRRELTETGYLKRPKNAGRERVKESAPLRYVSSEGTEILVGRSNTQNDRLTWKIARRGDIWMHVQKIHGSHVIIRCDGEEPGEKTLLEAASLAAVHSQASGGGKVPVDYTRVKFVKRPPGALPGMVTYSAQTTLTAQADEALEEKLRADK